MARRDTFSKAMCRTACSATDACPYPTTHFSWNSADFSSVSSAAISRNESGDLDVLAKVTAMVSGLRWRGLSRYICRSAAGVILGLLVAIENLSGSSDIFLDLRDQRRRSREPPFIAQVGDEFEGDLLPVQVAFEIKNMGFDNRWRFASLKSRTNS